MASAGRFDTNKVNYNISYYLHMFNSGNITTPKYQREHCWKPEFEVKLIMSILAGVDLPKIYLGQIKETGETHLIDGGHRSRTIDRFVNNEFHIIRDGKHVYYNKEFEQETKGKINLSEEEKRYFDNYHLDVLTYIDITEKECRNIFNDLQNAQPMSIEDVINSWQSDLVDYIRDLLDEPMEVDEETKKVREWFETYPKIMGNNKTEKTKMMTQLISWFTIIFPLVESIVLNPKIKEKEEISYSFLTKGNNNHSPCLNYVKEHRDDITDEVKEEFMGHLEYIFEYYKENSISPSDLYTLIHSRVNYFGSFDIETYEDLLETVKEYEEIKKESEKLQSSKKFELAALKFKEAEQLNNEYDRCLETWFKSRKNGGNNPSGMRKRNEIVLERCL
jgi:hypothetical protein